MKVAALAMICATIAIVTNHVSSADYDTLILTVLGYTFGHVVGEGVGEAKSNGNGNGHTT